MLKLCGCITGLTGAGGLGYVLARQMKQHLMELLAFQEMLYLLTGEMKHYRKTLEEAFRAVAEHSERYGVILMEIAERLKSCETETGSGIWRKSFVKNREKLLLDEDELELVLRTGHFLDAPDMEAKCRELKLYEDQMEEKIGRRRAELAERRKICMYGSMLGGIFIIIVLL